MPISSVYTPNVYTGDGVTTTYAISFPFLNISTFIKVSIKTISTGVITLKTAGTHYNVSGSNVVFTGGNIPAITEQIIIELNLDLLQSTNFPERDPFPSNAVTTALDKLTLEIQTNNDRSSRALKVDAAISLSGKDLTLHDFTAGKLFRVNMAGTGLELISASDINLTSSPTFDNINLNGSIALLNSGNGFRDAFNNPLFLVGFGANAVNYLTFTNAQTGSDPVLGVDGTDSNVSMSFQAKNVGVYKFNSTSSIASHLRLFELPSNGTNYIDLICPDSLSGNINFYLPSNAQAAGKVLQASSATDSSWVDITASTGDQTTGTSITTYVTPGRQQVHLSSNKAWGYYTVASNTIEISYNTSTIVKSSTGIFVVTLTTPMSSNFYAISISMTGANTSGTHSITTQSTTQFTVEFLNLSAAATDPTAFTYIVAGTV